MYNGGVLPSGRSLTADLPRSGLSRASASSELPLAQVRAMLGAYGAGGDLEGAPPGMPLGGRLSTKGSGGLEDLDSTGSVSGQHSRFTEPVHYRPGEVHSAATEAAMRAFEHDDKKSWHFRLGSARWGVRFNPLTMVVSVILIWGFIAWCIAQPEVAVSLLAAAKEWISDYWAWAYVLSQAVWVALIAVIYFSKYGNIKLGADDAQPEFSTGSWFFMIFAAGIGVGLFYYGVGETVWHYEPCYGVQFAGVDAQCTGQGTSANRFATMEDNTRAQMALNQTLFHWGFFGWVSYAQVGLLLALLCYRQGLPLTMKSCFYPLIGERIYGWMGDLVDVLSVITTLFGVCTSLGLGVLQLNKGLSLFAPSIAEGTTTQIVIIWIITTLATISAVSGIHLGIRRLAEITFMMGLVVVCCMFFMGPSFFLLNLYVQSWGWQLWTLLPLSLQVDAFAHLDVAPDGRGAGATWMNDWTIFYWGWWISWAPFVGTFAAKISHGRTVREFLNGVMVVPVMYSFFWLVVFGGAGLQMEREAARHGVMCSYSTGLGPDMPVGFVCIGPDGASSEAARQADPGTGYGETCAAGYSKISRLSCYSAERQYFLLWEQFDVASYRFFGIFSLCALTLFFVTSSDTASVVLDCLTANGNPHPPLFQRVFWSVTEGAAACALLIAGGKQAVTAVQTAAILTALPYTFILCFVCPALWHTLKEEGGDLSRHRTQFHCHLVDPITNPGMSSRRWLKLLKNVFLPMLDISRAAASQHAPDEHFARMLEFAAASLTFGGWVLLLALIPVVPMAVSALAWTLYVAFVANLTRLRGNARAVRGIDGHAITDACACLVAYPLVATQLGEELDANGPLQYKQL